MSNWQERAVTYVGIGISLFGIGGTWNKTMLEREMKTKVFIEPEKG